MSNTVKMTKTFEIEPSGNCGNCECLQELKQYKNSHVCNAFQEEIINCQQCKSCKEFLKAESEKVYCEGCIHFNYDYDESDCNKGNENRCKELWLPGDWYCNNCKDKEVIE